LPIVLLHGLGASGALWQRVRAPLRADYRLITPDLRAAGKTRELKRGDLSLALWAEDLSGLLADLDVRRPIVVGHSLGAAVALKYALEFPDDLRALVLISTDPTISRIGPRMRSSVERIGNVGFAGWVDEYWSKAMPFSATSMVRDPTIVADYRTMLLANDGEDYVRQCLAISSAEDLAGRLDDVTHPALVIVGDKDDRTRPEHGRELAEQLPDARLQILTDVGHTAPMEAAVAVADAIKTFSSEVLAASSAVEFGEKGPT
jgi:3-oxoadipate enol-lactonase